MTTSAIPRQKVQPFRDIILPTRYVRSQVQAIRSPYSTLALTSIGCIVLFVAFIIAYQTPAFDGISFASKALWSSLFVVIAPAVALVTSAIALRKYVHAHEQVKGMMLAYVSFVVSTIYFVTALAMPLLLLGFYVLYVYMW